MTCLLLFYGGHVVDKGELRSGRLVSFMLLTQSLSDSFNTLADMYSNIADALGAADKVFELLERKPAADAPPAPLNMDDDDDEECRGDVSFEDVAFASVWKSKFGRGRRVHAAPRGPRPGSCGNQPVGCEPRAAVKARSFHTGVASGRRARARASPGTVAEFLSAFARHGAARRCHELCGNQNFTARSC